MFLVSRISIFDLQKLLCFHTCPPTELYSNDQGQPTFVFHILDILVWEWYVIFIHVINGYNKIGLNVGMIAHFWWSHAGNVILDFSITFFQNFLSYFLRLHSHGRLPEGSLTVNWPGGQHLRKIPHPVEAENAKSSIDVEGLLRYNIFCMRVYGQSATRVYSKIEGCLLQAVSESSAQIWHGITKYWVKWSTYCQIQSFWPFFTEIQHFAHLCHA